MLSPCQR